MGNPTGLIPIALKQTHKDTRHIEALSRCNRVVEVIDGNPYMSKAIKPIIDGMVGTLPAKLNTYDDPRWIGVIRPPWASWGAV
jgi:hypothetical protein